MREQYEEVRSTSWFEKLAASFLASILGISLFLGSFVLLEPLRACWAPKNNQIDAGPNSPAVYAQAMPGLGSRPHLCSITQLNGRLWVILLNYRGTIPPG
jgi:hypothetical protein